MRNKIWETKKFDDFHGYLYAVNNGKMDVEGFIDSSYGEELAKRLSIRFLIEDDIQKAEEYYDSIGLIRKLFSWDNYYERYSLLIPKDAYKRNEKMPLVFWLHGLGNSLEAEENMTGFTDIANKEGFMLCSPQNTNPEKILEIIEEIASLYNLDRSRIYLAGFSHGASQIHGLYFRHPNVFAGVLTSGDEVYCPWDSFDTDYTEEELIRCKNLKMPIFLISGQCEPFPFAPMNEFHPKERLPRREWGRPDTSYQPDKDMQKDPTRLRKKFVDASGNVTTKIIMARDYSPSDGEDSSIWNLSCLNKRLDLLNLKARDIDKCLSFKSLHEDDIHRILGFYGDYEKIEYHYGYRHYVIGINDENNHQLFKFAVVSNSPHWPQLAIGEMGWDFLRHFSRDLYSGELIYEE